MIHHFLTNNDPLSLHITFTPADDSDDEAPAPKKPTSAKKKGELLS